MTLSRRPFRSTCWNSPRYLPERSGRCRSVIQQSPSGAPANFAAVLDAATEDNDEVVITRSGGKEAAVVISLREWEAMAP